MVITVFASIYEKFHQKGDFSLCPFEARKASLNCIFSGFLLMPLLSFSNSLTTTYLHTIILTQNSMSREHLYLLNKYVSRYYSIPFTIPLQPFSPRHFPPAIFPLNLVEISPPFSPQVSKFGINT